jgi:hypothetical protein
MRAAGLHPRGIDDHSPAKQSIGSSSNRRRRRQPGARKIGWRVKVRNDTRIGGVNVLNAAHIGVNHYSRTLILRRSHQFGKHIAIEKHRMATPAIVSGHDDWTCRLAVLINQGAERSRQNQWMVGKMNYDRVRISPDRLGETNF